MSDRQSESESLGGEAQTQHPTWCIAVFVDEPRTGERLYVTDIVNQTDRQCLRVWERMSDLRHSGHFSVFWAMLETQSVFVGTKMIAVESVEQVMRCPLADILEHARAMRYDYAQVCRDLEECHAKGMALEELELERQGLLD